MDKKYRHEIKYLISKGQLEILKTRLDGLIKKDPHVGKDGKYNICSLYFDDYYNSCYYENENGTDPREKYRIRIYNHSTKKITLECKRKMRGKNIKNSCPLTLNEAKILSQGKYIENYFSSYPLMNKFQIDMKTRLFRPVVIVDYDRYPYVYKDGNVRITLDTNIAASSLYEKFLEGGFAKRPVMPKGLQLLEVKYDEYLPDFIYRSLQLENLRQTAYSKYYICRRFNL
ncbi:polyphosphate polymerase domain-containing protein [Acetitomaculum ruminis]|nr:polyphosphate polymerase domain-containing protein [Acetitomaculum ruminis]